MPRKRITVACARCGQEFQIEPAKMRWGRGKFCGRECYAASLRGPRPGSTVARNCATCGKQFTTWANGERAPRVRFCSLPCAATARQTGTQRSSPGYKRWRAAVLERDNHTCRRCGKKPKGPLAHHVRPYDEFPELRLDVTNGLTLCRPCHRLEHEQGDH